MNEIEKMMQNAGVVNLPYCCDECCGTPTKECAGCTDYREIYPPFTAEKELKLIKWFAHSGHFSHQTDYLPWIVDDIAGHLVYLWNRFSDTEQVEIRKILEGK